MSPMVSGLRSRLSLPVVDRPSDEFDYYIQIRKNLAEPVFAVVDQNGPCVELPWFSKSFQWRLFTTGRKQILGRALGLSRHPNYIWDATAGLASDAITISHLGFPVVACEISPIIFELSNIQLQAIKGDRPDLKERLTLWLGNSEILLSRLSISDYPDVIYIDPMFPLNHGTALSKKTITTIRKWVSHPVQSSSKLIDIACQIAQKRVVVKRPLWAPSLLPSVSHCYRGNTVRFDVMAISESAFKARPS